MNWNRVICWAHIIIGWFILHGGQDTIGQETEEGPYPQQDGEAPKKLTTELDPLRCRGGWSEGVRSIPSQNVLSSLVGQALGMRKDIGVGVWNVPGLYHTSWHLED